MEKLIGTGRIFYGIAIAAVGFQQCFYADFHPMVLPPGHTWLPALGFWAWFSGAAFLASGAAIVFAVKVRTVSLVLGTVLLAIFCFYYIPYELFVDPYYKHLGEWGEAEKELALSGGGFVIAGTYTCENGNTQKKPLFIRFLEKLIPFGRIFFSITMISFGIDHLYYTKPISTMIPAWIPAHIFWTYFAAFALIGSGITIILKIKDRLTATLLGLMILLWFIFLHIPGAIAHPFTDKGNEVTSAFSALAFSGIAFVIAGSRLRKHQ
ncbi:DoxX family membrane protein [Flavitalea flava]